MLLRHFAQDLRASLVVFLVALPLCLGISLASGAPLFSGILSGVIGGIVVGIISSSDTSVSGPGAGLTVIILAAMAQLGDFYTFTLAVFFAGVFQLLFSLFRGGKLGGYFPNSVIEGMLAAIGLLLILKHLPHVIGFTEDFIIDMSFRKGQQSTLDEISHAFKSMHFGIFLVATLSFISMIIWEKLGKKGYRFFKIFPGSLFAVILGVILNTFVLKGSLVIPAEYLVNLPSGGSLSSFLSTLHMPNWEAISNIEVYKIALTIAIVASLETLLSVEAVDKFSPYRKRTRKNRELFAQGIGNVLAGLVGGLPVTSVIVRSSANVTAKASSKLSTIFHGFWLFLAIVFIPSYLSYIPLASLSAILLFVGYELATPKLFKKMWNQGSHQFIPFIVTILAIIFTDLLKGIGIGFMITFFFILRSYGRKSIVLIHEGNDYLIRFMKDTSFFQKPFFAKMLEAIPDGANVLIDGSGHVAIDHDIIVMLEEFLEFAHEREITCTLKKSNFSLSPLFKKA